MSTEPHPRLLQQLSSQTPPRCPRCGSPLRCGVAEGKSSCWCFAEPAVFTVPDGGACLCRDCLRTLTAEAGETEPR